MRRGAALGREREAADRDQARAGRPVGRARDRAAGERPPGRGDLGEAPGPGRLQPAHRAERRQRRAAAVGLLEAEPVLARLPRRERDRAGVDRGVDDDGQADEHLLAGAARAADGALAAAAQDGARLRVERERAAGGRDEGVHRPNQSRSVPQ